MLVDLLTSFWSVLLVILFFGASILVHELGHFWAARWRGVYVERFSIGFGPKIIAWKGKSGTEYRLSWLPLGGYVALPQLADLAAIEGTSSVPLQQLPPPTYGTRLLVFSAGAVMNLVFAFALACILWIHGLPMSKEMTQTRIGYVLPEIELSDGSKVQSPASKAGLLPGDKVLSIDSVKTETWIDLMQTLMTSSGRSLDGRPRTQFTVEREGRVLELLLYPQLAGVERDRRVGITPGYDLLIHSVEVGSVAEKAGFRAGDKLLRVDGQRLHSLLTLQDAKQEAKGRPLSITVERAEGERTLSLPPTEEAKEDQGFVFTAGYVKVHTQPFKQIWDQVLSSFRILGSLLSPNSDIGLSKMSGPVGILRIFHNAAEAGWLALITFTILVNVSLAVFNLLPIPVLDGGHIVLATLARVRGKPLPINLIASIQTAFLLLLLAMMVYVSVFDVKRLRRDATAEKEAATQTTRPAK